HDGSPNTTSGLRRIARFVNASGAHMIVLHVATPEGEHRKGCGALTAPRYVDQAHHEWPAWMHEFLLRFARACGCAPGTMTRRMWKGEAASAVGGFVTEQDIDRICLAWYGGLDENGADVRKRVLREATCPVVIVQRNDDDGRDAA